MIIECGITDHCEEEDGQYSLGFSLMKYEEKDWKPLEAVQNYETQPPPRSLLQCNACNALVQFRKLVYRRKRA